MSPSTLPARRFCPAGCRKRKSKAACCALLEPAGYDRRAKTSVRQAYVSDLQKRSSLSVRVLDIMDHPA
jgi:hypothetical protein